MERGSASRVSESPEICLESVTGMLNKFRRAVLVTDNKGKICHVNSVFSEMTGYEYDEVIGANPRMFGSGTTRKSTYIDLWSTISAGRVWVGVLQNKRKDRSRYFEKISIAPIVDDDGKIHYYLAEIEEINFNESQPFIGLLNAKQLEHFRNTASQITHLCNNVLAGVEGVCALIQLESESSSAVAKRVEQIYSVNVGLKQFVKRVALCAGYPLVHATTVELNAIIAETIRELNETIESTVKVRGKPYVVPMYVDADVETLKIALVEILKNAVEEMASFQRLNISQIEVDVSKVLWNGFCMAESVIGFDAGLSGREVAQISISDHGGGMNSIHLRKAVDLFFSTKRTHVGLGLPIVLGVVNSIGGAVSIESLPGQGTLVRLSLPLSNQASN